MLRELRVMPKEHKSFPGGSVVKKRPANAGDPGSIPTGDGNGSLLQYPCLENPMDRRARWTAVRGVSKELDTAWQLNSKSLKKLHWPFDGRFENQNDNKPCQINREPGVGTNIKSLIIHR